MDAAVPATLRRVPQKKAKITKTGTNTVEEVLQSVLEQLIEVRCGCGVTMASRFRLICGVSTGTVHRL